MLGNLFTTLLATTLLSASVINGYNSVNYDFNNAFTTENEEIDYLLINDYYTDYVGVNDDSFTWSSDFNSLYRYVNYYDPRGGTHNTNTYIESLFINKTINNQTIKFYPLFTLNNGELFYYVPVPVATSLPTDYENYFLNDYIYSYKYSFIMIKNSVLNAYYPLMSINYLTYESSSCYASNLGILETSVYRYNDNDSLYSMFSFDLSFTDNYSYEALFDDNCWFTLDIKLLDLNTYFSGAIDNAYNNGYSNGYNTGYNSGYATGISENNKALPLFMAIADTPIIMLRSLFSFDFFGISFYSILLGVITILIVVWLIRKLIK